jgi:RNA polymerase sigma-70 factor (ECF subfamily)
VCLRSLGNKDDASNAVQDTFLQLVRDAAKITGSLPSWLHRTATNRAIDLIRQDSQRKKREFIYAASPESINAEDEKAAWREISVCIDEELENLDDQTEEILILRFFEGQTMAEIATKFGISQPTISRRIDSGIELLRQKLKSKGIIVSTALFMTLLSKNIVKGAPASILKELGKIAIAGSKATISAKITSSVSIGIAVKTKIIAGILIVLIGAGSAVVFSLIANGENKPASTWEIIQQSMQKRSDSGSNKTTETKPVKNGANIKLDELLDNYTKALDPIQSFIGTFESSALLNSDIPSWGLKHDNQTSYSRGEVRTDGKGKTSQTSFSWGYVGEYIPENQALYHRIVAGDDFVYSFNKRLNLTKYNGRENHGQLTYQTPQGNSDFKLSRDDVGLLNNYGTISYFLGYLDTTARLDWILKNAAKHISMRPESEMVNGSLCYIIEADTKYGDFTVWFDSEHGYHPARIEGKVGVSDSIGSPGNPSIITKEQGIERDYTLENVRFEKIDGTWVPMEADSKRYVILGNENGFSDEQSHFKFTKITINPDHEALNSFGNPAKNPELDPELENGSIIYHIGYEAAVWKDGKVVDSSGKAIDLDSRGPKLVIGKELPDLSEFNIDLNPGTIRNKMLLICFFDMNQRPSRNEILSLNKKAQT